MAGFRLAPQAARARRQPWQRRRVVLTAPTIVVTTRSFTVDAIVQEQGLTRTFTVDAIVLQPQQGVAQGGLIFLFAPTQRTFTVDAVIAASIAVSRTNTFTVDAIVRDPATTRTFTVDAIVQSQGLTRTFTVDAIILASLPVTTRTRSIGVDAIVVDSGQGNLSARIGYWLSRRRRKMETKKSYFKLVETGTTRTSTYRSPTLEADVEPGVVVFLDVTAASGTGGLTVRINAVDGASGQHIPLNTAPTAVTSTGQYTYAVYPFGAISGNLTQSTSGYLPTQFSISVTAGDSSSYTYSLGYCLLP